MNREGGHVGHDVFDQKLLTTQHSGGRCAQKSPIMKWVNLLKESSKKNSLKLNAASHYNASWCAATDGLQEHSPGGWGEPVLQGAHPPEDNSVLGGGSSSHMLYT